MLYLFGYYMIDTKLTNNKGGFTMKKRVLSLLIISSLMLALVGCGGGEKAAGLKDGTYVGKTEMTDYGYEEAEVTVENGEITDVVLKRMTPEGEEVDYDEWDGTSEDGKPNLKEAKDTVAAQMVEKQSSEVDTVAGATSSVDNWKIAFDEAVSQAK